MANLPNPHGITARQIASVQPMTQAISPGWHFAHGVDLFGPDAHKRVSSGIDVAAVKRANHDVAEKLCVLKIKLKDTKRRNSLKRAQAVPPNDVSYEDTSGYHDQVAKLAKRAGRCGNFIYWLRVGNQAKPRIKLSTGELKNLIAEFYTDPITRLGSIVR